MDRRPDDRVTFAYPAQEPELLTYVRSRLTDKNGTGKGNLFLTGAIGSGKSTFVQHLIDDLDADPSGYMTIRHVDADEKRIGFVHVPAANQRGTGFLTVRHDKPDSFPIQDCFLYVDESGRHFKLDSFYLQVEAYLRKEGSLLILDELGGDELLLDDFYQLVMKILEESAVPVILVWKQDRSFERSVARAGLSDDEIDLLRRRRQAIETHPSLFQVELSNGGRSADHWKRAVWGRDEKDVDSLPRQETVETKEWRPKTPALAATVARERRPWLIFLIMGGALLVIVFISLAVGWYGISPATIFSYFWSRIFRTGAVFPQEIHTVLIHVRLPRILLGLLTGGGLAAAGHTFQGVFRNPMASPDVLGASSGAGFGAALAILWGFGSSGITGMSFLFGLLSILLVLFLTSFIRSQKILALVLTGMVVSSLFSAGLSLVKLVADPTNQLPQITYWLMGSLNSAKMKQLTFAAPAILAGILVILLLRWQLNVLTMGEEAAASMGVRTRLVRVVLILAATLVTATAVSVSGIIGWVGLVIPHIARMTVGSDNRYSLPASVLMGAGFLVLVDDIARRATTSGIPLGILTAFVGAPFFIYLILRQGKREVTA
jgi:iron complex transport system permease protein